MGNEKPVRRQSAVDWYVEYCRDDLNPSLVKASDYDSLAQRERKLVEALTEAVALRVSLYRHSDFLDEDKHLSDEQVAQKDKYARRWTAALRSSDHIEGEK